ncbi:MAG: Na/Pi cotransporter family protein [Oligoflexia bacterium]|nr:Na/Pi cotransporter family protein [Oligoflexia bacterium]
MGFFEITTLVGGLAIFLHGIGLTREGLQVVAGERLRSLIFALSKNRVIALFTGVVVTMILQSSTATTVMVVGFASSALMSLNQATAVLLGADIGTTVTVQLISFHLSAYALTVVSLGFVVRAMSKRKRNQYIGQIIMGFGLLFLGMKLAEDATVPLKSSEVFRSILDYFSMRPLAGMVAAGAATIFFQGSAPTIGFMIALASAGSLSLESAMPMVLGANIGTTINPIFMTMKASTEGRRVAVAHMLFKVMGVLLIFPFLREFESFVIRIEPIPWREIANAHTLFNLLNSLVSLPLVGLSSRLISSHYTPKGQAEKFGPKYLDARSLETPVLAFGNAQREFLRMADLVNEILRDSVKVMGKVDLDMVADIEERDDKVDILNREIRFYLAKLTQEILTRDQAEKQMELISLSNDVENIGDLVNHNILALARTMVKHSITFSQQGWEEIRDFHGKVCENFDLALIAYATQDEEIARKVIRHRTTLISIENQLKEKHIARLSQGTRESIETSSVHLDLLAHLRQINGYIGNIADAVVKVKSAESS